MVAAFILLLCGNVWKMALSLKQQTSLNLKNNIINVSSPMMPEFKI